MKEREAFSRLFRLNAPERPSKRNRRRQIRPADTVPRFLSPFSFGWA
jgi:hypothetical protein